MCNVPQQAPIGKVPKDGPGPRGAPEAYYTSRVLNSTFRYVKFVKRLRAQEEEQRKGAENALKMLRDRQTSDFFIKCDRRSLIKTVALRVDLCLAAYEDDLNKKRKRLTELFKKEEEQNIRKLVEQGQAGAEIAWQKKLNRLAYLLEERRKEQMLKYKDTPLSKCVHVLPCIYKMRAKEAEQIQLYQIKEKEHRKMAEREFDKMWYEVTMSESEALKARMERDAIERYRREMNNRMGIDAQLEQSRIKRERDREMLKEETKRLAAIWQEDIRKDQEEQKLESHQTLRDSQVILEENRERAKKLANEQKEINDTWNSLIPGGIQADAEKEALRTRKKIENASNNRELMKLKTYRSDLDRCTDELVEQERCRLQQKNDELICQRKMALRQRTMDNQKALMEQIHSRIYKDKQPMLDELSYNQKISAQNEQLIKLKERDEARDRKMRQRQLLDQIEYNRVLKERALQEEKDQIRKAHIAAQEYQDEIERMMCRPFFSEEVHPFLKQMAKGLNLQRKCPCSKPDYCAP